MAKSKKDINIYPLLEGNKKDFIESVQSIDEVDDFGIEGMSGSFYFQLVDDDTLYYATPFWENEIYFDVIAYNEDGDEKKVALIKNTKTDFKDYSEFKDWYIDMLSKAISQMNGMETKSEKEIRVDSDEIAVLKSSEQTKSRNGYLEYGLIEYKNSKKIITAKADIYYSLSKSISLEGKISNELQIDELYETVKGDKDFYEEAVKLVVKILHDNFLSKIVNLGEVKVVGGNHDRSTSDNKEDVQAGAANLVCWGLELLGYNVEFNPLVITHTIGKITHILTHGHHALSKKSTKQLCWDYGVQGNYNLICEGHLHSIIQKLNVNQRDTFQTIKDDAVDHRRMNIPSFFTGNFFSESLGYTSESGFVVVEDNGKGVPNVFFYAV